MHDRQGVQSGVAEVKLVDVYEMSMTSCVILYELLAERTPEQSISHKHMPTMEEHAFFIGGRPYLHWYIALDGDEWVGAVYLSKQREIGVSIRGDCRGKGYGSAAVMELMRLHPGKFLANMNPANEASEHLFKALGFKLIQHTYALEAT